MISSYIKVNILKNTSNPVELILDIPSSLCNLLEYKLRNALELTKKGAKKKELLA